MSVLLPKRAEYDDEETELCLGQVYVHPAPAYVKWLEDTLDDIEAERDALSALIREALALDRITALEQRIEDQAERIADLERE